MSQETLLSLVAKHEYLADHLHLNLEAARKNKKQVRM